MRISERHRYTVATERMEGAKSRNTKALEVLSTQKRINDVSDDPIGMTNIITKRDRIDALKTYQRNISFSKGFLDVAESSLQGISDKLMRARELAIAMANDTYAIDSRQATAREIKEIINEVIQLGNATYNNRYVFSGFRTKTPPLSSDGNFNGDDGVIYLQVEDKNLRQINIPGRELFNTNEEERQKGHFNLVDGLEVLKSGLENDDKQAIYKAIEEIGFQLEKSTSYQARIGAVWGAIDKAEKRIESQIEQEISALSKIEDADVYEATSDFKRTESILQSTLMASNKLLQPSLLNFMQ